MRRVIAALIVVGLAVGVLVLWPRPVAEENVDSEALGSATTTSDVVTTTTTTGTTSTTGEESHVVETVEEAEEILREHYLRWFLGIYSEDESLIRSTAILESQVEAAKSQFGIMEFDAQPTSEGLQFSGTEILRSDEDCLAVWAEISATFRPGNTQGVVVFRRIGTEWRMLSSWPLRGDLWEADCESLL
jgi:hypothetical protein